MRFSACRSLKNSGVCGMKSLSAARSSSPYSQCLICRVWSWDACNSFDGATLCLPCYVDVLEVRQDRLERGAMGEPVGGPKNSKAPQANITGSSLSPFRQLELFD